VSFPKLVVLATLLVLCLTLSAQSAEATTVLISDTTDVVTVTGAVFNCIGESCTIKLIPPAGAHSLTTTLPNPFHLAEAPATATSGTFQASDELNTNGLGLTNGVSSCPTTTNLSCTLQFISDPSSSMDPHLTTPCQVNTSNCIPETGAPQDVGTINWYSSTNGTGTPLEIDTVQMASDAAEPEPATLILFGSGFVMAGGFIWRRRRVVTPSVVA
jgi:hypothetical protein